IDGEPGDGRLGREYLARAAKPGDRESMSHPAGVSCAGSEVGYVLPMIRAELVRNQDVERLAEYFVAVPAEGEFRALVEVGDALVRIHGDDCVSRDLHDAFQARLGPPERELELFHRHELRACVHWFCSRLIVPRRA